MASQKRRVDRRDSGETERISVTLPIDTKTAITDYAKQLGVTASNVTHHFISVGMAGRILSPLKEVRLLLISRMVSNFQSLISAVISFIAAHSARPSNNDYGIPNSILNLEGDYFDVCKFSA